LRQRENLWRRPVSLTRAYVPGVAGGVLVLGAALVSGEVVWPAGAPICSGGVCVAGGV